MTKKIKDVDIGSIDLSKIPRINFDSNISITIDKLIEQLNVIKSTGVASGDDKLIIVSNSEPMDLMSVIYPKAIIKDENKERKLCFIAVLDNAHA